jgi:hypothetical protein
VGALVIFFGIDVDHFDFGHWTLLTPWMRIWSCI